MISVEPSSSYVKDSFDVSKGSSEIELASNALDDDEEEEIPIEPRFKYERILNDVVKLLETDGASCFAIHDKFLVIGCRSGRVCVFDHLGHAHLECTARHHKYAVTCLSIDDSGNYIISCANDSRVSIFGIGCDEYNQVLDLKFYARSVAISEDFSKQGSGQKFVTGERSLILYERGFLGSRKETVIYQGLERDGYIHTISWNGPHIAFTNETGTRIYDSKLSRIITLIQPLHKVESFYSTKLPPVHTWLDSRTLAIGWGNSICISSITVKKHPKSGAMVKCGEVLHKWIVADFYIAGISYTLGNRENISAVWEEIAVFGIKVNEARDTSMNVETESVISDMSMVTTAASVLHLQPGQESTAELLLLRPIDVDNYIIMAEDAIKMHHAEPKYLKYFHLSALPEDSAYFLLSLRELIEAHPCAIDDRVMWFLDNNLYVEAMDCALAHRDALQNVSVSEVGRQLVENLIKDGKFDTAARYVKQICGWDKEEWEHYVGQFEEHHHVLKLVPVIPTKSPQLEPECYEVILTSALICKPMLFKKLVHMWNPDLYRVGAIIDKIIKRMHDNLNHDPNQSSLSKEEITYLYQSLAHLYVYTRNFERALELYLLLKDPAVFNAIKKHRLFGHVKDRIVELMDINADLAVRLLLDDDEETVPSSTVVTQLSRMPKLQMLYLNRLLSKGEGLDHSDLLIKLYAEYDKDKLLSFLRKAENYKIDQALEICKRHNYIEEVIFLLGKSGDRFEALDVIMNMGRIEKAIDFCTEHEDDVELWNRLIELAMRRPDHITRLLSSAGSYINPLEVIQKIPSEMDIPGLRKSVMKVLRDYELQVGLLGVSQQVIQEDVLTLFEKTLYHPGILIDTEIRCDICKETLRPDPKSRKASQELRLFACGHNLHKSCVENQLSHEDFKKATMSDINKKLALNPFDEDFEICPACYVQNEQQIELGIGDDSNATSPITPVPMSMI